MIVWTVLSAKQMGSSLLSLSNLMLNRPVQYCMSSCMAVLMIMSVDQVRGTAQAMGVQCVTTRLVQE
eukprot:3686083-Amphidinium_carterae.1